MTRSSAQELQLALQAGWRVIALETVEEKRALVALEAVAQACDCELVVWSVASGLDASGSGAGSLDEGLRAISAHTSPAIFVLLDAQRLLDEAIALRRLRDLLDLLAERKQAIVLTGPLLELPPELGGEVARLTLPRPRGKELAGLFRQAVPDACPDVLDAAVKAALGLTATEAVRVLRRACALADGLNNAAVTEIVREKRQALRRAQALDFHEPESGLEGIGGLGELKRWLVKRRRAFSEEARAFGLPTPRGLLLLGVQGCGKSLSAKAVAREWQFPLLRLDLAAAFGGASQSPEATIREATAVAESIAPAVLWIDEIEKGFAAAAAGSASGRVFGSFLTWLAEKEAPVFVVATANDVASLPPELLRRGRFDELFFVDLPSESERAEILAIHLRARGRDPLHFAVPELAAQAARLSGAELEQVVSAALYHAFGAGRELEYNDLANAINDTVPLYETYEERIKELRDWARSRARPASLDARAANLFDKA